MALSTSFQKRLTALIDNAEMTRSEFEKEAKVGAGAISNALNYGIIPKPMTLIKIADYFDISVAYLLGEEEDNFIKSDSGATFKDRYVELCAEKGFSNYKVSKDCCFDKKNIKCWLTKGYLPSLEILYLLCDLFDVGIDYLLGRTDYRN